MNVAKLFQRKQVLLLKAIQVNSCSSNRSRFVGGCLDTCGQRCVVPKVHVFYTSIYAFTFHAKYVRTYNCFRENASIVFFHNLCCTKPKYIFFNMRIENLKQHLKIWILNSITVNMFSVTTLPVMCIIIFKNLTSFLKYFLKFRFYELEFWLLNLSRLWLVFKQANICDKTTVIYLVLN